MIRTTFSSISVYEDGTSPSLQQWLGTHLERLVNSLSCS
jgi:hypothetical protein